MSKSSSATITVTRVVNNQFIIEPIKGFLMKMPRRARAAGIKKSSKHQTQDHRNLYRKVRLFKACQLWWLYYTNDHCTGSFPSKIKAMGWFMNGGR